MLHPTGKDHRKLLLTAIRHTLFGTPLDPEDFRCCDWDAFFSLAMEQTVMTLALDGIDGLPKDVKPGFNLVLRYANIMLTTEKKNAHINAVLISLYRQLKESGFSPVIMKGQVAAADYPNPMHRQPGDIDVWFPDAKEAGKAIDMAKRNYKCRWMPGEKEVSFEWKGVTIELHRRIADMQYKPYQRFLQQAISDLMSSCPQREVEINGVTIAAMPSLLTMLHQLLHIEYHVLREGIGLRQFCDLAVFLQRYSEEIKGRHSRKEIQRLIDGCGISDVAAAVGHILHSELNLPTEHIPFRTSENGAELIMEDIWQGGNFGKLLTARYEGYGFIRRKIVMTPLHWKRYRRYRHLLPNEAFANFISKFGRAAKGVK